MSSPGTCSGVECIPPMPENYRFPPNTCVDYGDGCGACPVVSLQSPSCLSCPASQSENLDYKVDYAEALNSTALSGCKEEYTGVLCKTCNDGYTRSGEFACAECWSPGLVLLATIAIGVLGMLVLAYFVRSTIASEGKPSSETIMVLKQVANHMQILGMVALIPLHWPKSVETFFGINNQVSNPGGEATFSVDCELATWSAFASPFYAKATLVALLPIVAVGAACLFWVVLRLYRQRKGAENQLTVEDIRNRMVVSAVVILFFMHINLTKTALAFFTCTDPLDGGPGVGKHTFLEADTRIECYAGSHTAWSFGLGGGMLVHCSTIEYSPECYLCV